MSLVAAQLVAKVVADTKPAEDGLRRVGEHANKTGGFLQGALKNALGFAAGAVGVASVGDAFSFVTGQIGDMFQAGLQANAVQAQTAAVLKSTHDASGMTAASVDKLATQLMNLTGINDDTVQSTENILLTFTSIGKKSFPDATKAALDMATAMKIGPQQAALLVGKALNDPIQGMTALRREGVQLSKAQQDQVKHFMAVGDKAKAQKIILGELNKEFGGSAKAAGKANGGIKILAAQFDNAKQQVGQALIPILTKLMDKLAPLVIQFAQKLPGAIQTLTTWIQNVAGKVGDFINFLQTHQAIFDIIKASLLGVGIAILASLVPAFIGWAIAAGAAAIATIAAAAPIIAIGLAIGLLILGIKALIEHGDQVKAFFGHIKDAVLGFLGGVLGAIGDFFGTFFGAIGTFFGNLFGKLGDFAHKLFDLMTLPYRLAWVYIQFAIATVKSFLFRAWQTIVSDVKNVLGGLKNAVGNIWNGVVGVFKGGVNLIISDINLLIRALDSIQIHIPSVGVGPAHTPAFDWNGLNIPQIPYLAKGGVILGAGDVLVGERGPEVLRLPRGASVAPLTGGTGGTGGGPTTIILELDGRAVARALLPHTVAAIRNRTGVRA